MTKRLQTLPALGALATSAVLFVALYGAVAAGRVGQAPYFRIDKLAMTTTCAGEAPIYAAPDGRFWAWNGGWSEVEFSWGEGCH